MMLGGRHAGESFGGMHNGDAKSARNLPSGMDKIRLQQVLPSRYVHELETAKKQFQNTFLRLGADRRVPESACDWVFRTCRQSTMLTAVALLFLPTPDSPVAHVHCTLCNDVEDNFAVNVI